MSNLLTRDKTGESRIVFKRFVDVGKLEASITTGQSWLVRIVKLPILLLLVFFCFYTINVKKITFDKTIWRKILSTTKFFT